jgi:hypothetical protein
MSTEGFPAAPDYEKLVVTAHCVVNHPTEGNETGWAALDTPFRDKGGGWGTWSFFNAATYIDPIDIFYSIQQNADGDLNLIHINGGTNVGGVFYTEPINASGVVGAAAYDPLTGNLFYIVGNTLYVTNLSSDQPAQLIGNILGTPIGGTFANGNYYYFDGDPISPNYNEIIEVWLTFDANSGWSLEENEDFSTALPPEFDLNIIDLAADGSTIYLVGINSSDEIILITFNGNWPANSTDVVEIDLEGAGIDVQIAVNPDPDSGDNLFVFYYLDGDPMVGEIDPFTGTEAPPSNPGTDDGPFDMTEVGDSWGDIGGAGTDNDAM